MTSNVRPVSFTLGDRELSFLSSMVKKGRFGNRTEAVRAGIRLLEDYENTQRLSRLRSEIAEGDADIAAGRVTECTNPAEYAQNIIAQGESILNASN